MGTIFTFFHCHTPEHWYLSKGSLYTCLVPSFYVWCPPFVSAAEGTPFDHLAGSGGEQDLCSWVQQDVNKDTVLNWLPPQGSVQREQREMPIFQSSPEKGPTRLYVFEYFKSCCLRVWLPTIVNLNDDWYPLLWDTDRSWLTLSYWEPWKIW